jgi:hypothetical protein
MSDAAVRDVSLNFELPVARAPLIPTELSSAPTGVSCQNFRFSSFGSRIIVRV